MLKIDFKQLINILQKVFFTGLLLITSTAFADEQTRYNLAKHYSPIIYQHVDTTGEHSLGGRSDQIMNFNYDGTWSGNVKWENLESNVGPASVYFTVIESATYWFIYYAIYHPRDWSKLIEFLTMHENDMEAVVLMVAKGVGYPGNLIAAMTMAHNAWIEYPIESSVTAINYDGTTDPNGNGVTFIQNKSVPEFYSDGYHPRIYIQSRGHGIFMDADSNLALQLGNAMEINNWDLTGFPKLIDYNGTGLVYYCSSDDRGETIYNIWDKLIDSGGDHDGSPDIYGSRWVKYELRPMSELWDKREWKKDNQNEWEWMFVVDVNGWTAFFGPFHGKNEAHPPWSIPDYPIYIDPLNHFNISSPGAIFYDPLNAFKQHFNGLNISSDEKYVHNPYYPYSEVKKILASDGAAYDWFGNSVSISGDTLVIGARGDDDNGGYSGSTYIFDRNRGGIDNWGEVKKITASDGTESDYFGYSISISGNTGVVGAPGGGDFGRGSIYIFERNQGGIDNWGEVKKITASDIGEARRFGHSVSINGNTLVIGDNFNLNENGFLSGAAYIYERNQGGPNNWGFVKKITPSERDYGDEFGYCVSINSDTLVIGARRDDDNGGDTGSIYIFDRNQGGIDNWGQVKKTFASDGGVGDYFGHSVSISGNTVVVGALNDDDNGGSSGSAYVFERNQGGIDNWGEAQKITASDGEQSLSAYFGHSVSISDDTVVVGAYWDDDNGLNTGSAYVFERDQGGIDNWGEAQKITASDGEMWDEFGYSLSISGNTVVVGAHQDNDNGNDTGSAYIYTAIDIDFCECDSDGDGDVDGSDLEAYIADQACNSLADFAGDFGRMDCPH